MKSKLFFAVSVLAVAILAGCNRDAGVASSFKADAKPIKLAEEVARAKAENKLLLLEFGSSDSCPPCEKFEKDVFSKPEFLAYEKSNLVFLRADFPFRTSLPADVNATNNLLSKQFDAAGFPTFVALDQSGNEVWRIPAKDDPAPTIDIKLFKPSEFIALLETLKAKSK